MWTHLNPLGLAGVAICLVAFQVTHRRLVPLPISRQWPWLFAFAVLALPSAGFALHYLHLWGEAEWFYELRSWPGSEFLAVFLGCAGGAAAALLPRRLLALSLLAVLGLAVLPHVKPLVGPLRDEAFCEPSLDGVCRQSTLSTCGPASMVNILRHLGLSATEREIARAAFTYSGGTEAWYLARHARRRGLSARFDFRETFSPEAGLPALVGVRLGRAGHFIAVLELKNGVITFVDPLRGQDQCPLDEFQNGHDFTGFHLVIQQPPTRRP